MGRTILLGLAAFAGLADPVLAQSQPAQPPATSQNPLEAAWVAAGKTAILGPAKIKLLDQGELAIPAGDAFVPAAEANQIMEAIGNPSSPTRFGLIVSRKDTDI